MIDICKHNIVKTVILSEKDFSDSCYDEKVYGWKHNSFQRPFNIFKNKILQAEDDVAV